MPYQAVVLPIVVGVGLAVAAVLYFISQGDSHTPHGNRPRNSGGTSHSHYSNSWEQGGNRSSKPKRKRSAQAEQNTCTVCHEELKDDIITLSCQHKFHVYCIAPWLKEKQSCPGCRQKATV